MTKLRNATTEEKSEHFALSASLIAMFDFNKVPPESAINATLFVAAQLICQIAKEEDDHKSIEGFKTMLSQVRDYRSKMKAKAH